jgi:hypothetical protein
MIVRESIGFQRGMSDRGIRDVLIGFREGQFLINPYTNIVYVHCVKNRKWYDQDDVEIFSIGHLRTKKTESPFAGKEFFQMYRKNDSDWRRTNFKSKDKLRSLENEEWRILKPSLTPEYINKLESELGIKVIMP